MSKKRNKKNKSKKKNEFSKSLLIQESALIWIMSICFLFIAFYCIRNGYMGTLPWLAAMVGFPWTAYGVSQIFYYKKSMAENTKDGVKFETALLESQKIASMYQDGSGLDFSYIDSIQNDIPIQDDIDSYQI